MRYTSRAGTSRGHFRGARSALGSRSRSTCPCASCFRPFQSAQRWAISVGSSLRSLLVGYCVYLSCSPAPLVQRPRPRRSPSVPGSASDSVRNSFVLLPLTAPFPSTRGRATSRPGFEVVACASGDNIHSGRRPHDADARQRAELRPAELTRRTRRLRRADALTCVGPAWDLRRLPPPLPWRPLRSGIHNRHPLTLLTPQSDPIWYLSAFGSLPTPLSPS